MPLHGCTLWDFSIKNVLRFFTGWRKSVRNLIKLLHRTHKRFLPHIVADRPVEVQLHNRFVNFLKSLSRSDNILLKLGFQLSISGSCSNVCNSCLYIKDKYGVKGDITNCGSISSSTELNVSDEFSINHIRDLLCMRELPQSSIFYEW